MVRQRKTSVIVVEEEGEELVQIPQDENSVQDEELVPVLDLTDIDGDHLYQSYDESTLESEEDESAPISKSDPQDEDSVEDEEVAPVLDLADIDGAHLYQSYDESTLESEEAESTPAATGVILLDYFPITEEDYEQGFRRISAKEKKAWNIAFEETDYDTISGMAAVLGVARNTAETWIYQCLEFYPSGFLKTRRGLTTDCLKVLEVYKASCYGYSDTKTRKNRFFKKLEEQREQYQAHMQAYHDKKKEEKCEALTHVSSVEGEFVDERTQLSLQVAFERSDRSFSSGVFDYTNAKIASAVHDTYRKAASLKPLMDQAIQNGLTGQNIPDLSQINKD